MNKHNFLMNSTKILLLTRSFLGKFLLWYIYIIIVFLSFHRHVCHEPSRVCYLWKPCSVRILIVAATKETVITSLTTNDQRFPDGLGVKGEKTVQAACSGADVGTDVGRGGQPGGTLRPAVRCFILIIFILHCDMMMYPSIPILLFHEVIMHSICLHR